MTAAAPDAPHVVRVRQADGTVVVHEFYGLTDEELADAEFMAALVDADHDKIIVLDREAGD